jgi:hypothetical protein
MATGREVARIQPATVAHLGSAAANPRQAIQEALSAYELAVATRLKAEQGAAADLNRHYQTIGLGEQNARREREGVQRASEEVAAAEAARIRALSEEASATEAAAIRLLETSALAHVRGFSDASSRAVRTPSRMAMLGTTIMNLLKPWGAGDL